MFWKNKEINEIQFIMKEIRKCNKKDKPTLISKYLDYKIELAKVEADKNKATENIVRKVPVIQDMIGESNE